MSITEPIKRKINIIYENHTKEINSIKILEAINVLSVTNGKQIQIFTESSKKKTYNLLNKNNGTQYIIDSIPIVSKPSVIEGGFQLLNYLLTMKVSGPNKIIMEAKGMKFSVKQAIEVGVDEYFKKNGENTRINIQRICDDIPYREEIFEKIKNIVIRLCDGDGIEKMLRDKLALITYSTVNKDNFEPLFWDSYKLVDDAIVSNVVTYNEDPKFKNDDFCIVVGGSHVDNIEGLLKEKGFDVKVYRPPPLGGKNKKLYRKTNRKRKLRKLTRRRHKRKTLK